MQQAIHRWFELESVPTYNQFVRGNFLHQQANMNLGGDFPIIDDFREGFATSVKTYNAPEQAALPSRIRGALNAMDGIETRTLSGLTSEGQPIQILPGDIQGKGLLVAIPGDQASWIGTTEFATAIDNLATEFDSIVQVVPVDAFPE